MSVLRGGFHVSFHDSSPTLFRSPVSFLTYQAGSSQTPAVQLVNGAILAKGTLGIVLDLDPGFQSFLPGGGIVWWLSSCDHPLS